MGPLRSSQHGLSGTNTNSSTADVQEDPDFLNAQVCTVTMFVEFIYGFDTFFSPIALGQLDWTGKQVGNQNKDNNNNKNKV